MQNRSECRRTIGEAKNGEIGAVLAVLEPTTSVGNPPTGEANGNRGEQRPPERQEQIGRHTQDKEGRPKDLFLHTLILTARSMVCRWPLASIAKEPLDERLICEVNALMRLPGIKRAGIRFENHTRVTLEMANPYKLEPHTSAGSRLPLPMD